VTLLHEGKKEEKTVKVESLEESTKVLAASVKERLGVEVRPLTPQEVEKYGLDNDQGVAITWLDAKGPLKEAGFELDDIILGIDNQPAKGVESFVQLVSSLKPNQKVSVLALDHRSGNSGTVQVTVR